MRVDQPVQVGGEPADVAKLPEMSDIERLGSKRHHALDRPVQRPGIELRRAGGWEGKLPAVNVDLPVRKAERVAGEKVAGTRIPHDHVMAGVARRVEKKQIPGAPAQGRPLRSLDHAPGRHGQDLAVHAPRRFLAVDRHGGHDQPRGIDHVARAPRVHREARVRAAGHQLPGAAGVVEVHMREHHVVDALRRHALLLQGGEHPRHGRRGGGVDDDRAPVLDHDVERGLHFAVVDRVHRADPMRVINDPWHRAIIESGP